MELNKKMARSKFKIGDVFKVQLDENTFKYFQYVATDATQLNSEVIRVFKKVFLSNETPKLNELSGEEIDFHVHVFLTLGLKMKLWEKIGHVSEIGKVEVLFRDSSDYGQPEIKVSSNWWVWRINENQKQVGKLIGENQKAEIGIVVNPVSVVNRIKYGKYDFVYPSFG